jgi:aminoglycoside/choline kinase family phosphotransferase
MEEPLRRLDKCFRKEFFDFCHKDFPAQLGIPRMLAHGDLWTNNLLWKKSANGDETDELAAIIDWQVVFAGCVTTDISRMTVVCCDAGERHELEAYIVEFYYEELKRLMTKDGGKQLDFSLESLKRAYAMAAVNQSIISAVIVPYHQALGVKTILNRPK